MSRQSPSASLSGLSDSQSDEEDENVLEQLTRTQVLELNAAWKDVAQSRPAKKRKKNGAEGKGKGKGKEIPAEQAPGGFILDDEDASAVMGGFIREEPAPSSKSIYEDKNEVGNDDGDDKTPGFILLDRVTSLLDSLGLDGDDPAVLSTFEHASQRDEDGNQIVRRRDFLKVAAVLISQRDEETLPRPAKVHSGGGKRRAIKLDVKEELEEHDDSDPLILSSEDEEDEEDPDNEDSDPWADEDDIDGTFAPGRALSPPSKRRVTRSLADDQTASQSSPLSSSGISSQRTAKGRGKVNDMTDKETKLSSTQKDECKHMFQQFFSSSETTKNQSISLAEIRYVAALLNEKLSDADVSQQPMSDVAPDPAENLACRR